MMLLLIINAKRLVELLQGDWLHSMLAGSSRTPSKRHVASHRQQTSHSSIDFTDRLFVGFWWVHYENQSIDYLELDPFAMMMHSDIYQKVPTQALRAIKRCYHNTKCFKEWPASLLGALANLKYALRFYYCTTQDDVSHSVYASNCFLFFFWWYKGNEDSWKSASKSHRQ